VLPAPSALSFGFPDLFRSRLTIPAADEAGAPTVVEQASLTLAAQRSGRRQRTVWPAVAIAAGPSSPLAAMEQPELPAPSLHDLDLGGPLGPKLAIPVKFAPASRMAARTTRARTALVAPRRAVPPRARPVVRQAAQASVLAPEPAAQHRSNWARMLNWFP
jgi:hypothetical protein